MGGGRLEVRELCGNPGRRRSGRPHEPAHGTGNVETIHNLSSGTLTAKQRAVAGFPG